MAYIIRERKFIRAKKGFYNKRGELSERSIQAYLEKAKARAEGSDLPISKQTDPVRNRKFMRGTLLAPENPRDREILRGLLRDEVDDSRLARDENDDGLFCPIKSRKRKSFCSSKEKKIFEKARKDLAKQLADIIEFETRPGKGPEIRVKSG